ncbi:MAG: GspE/PulE family protein [Phycisphaerales bacterium]
MAAPTEDFLRLIPQEYARRHLLLSGGRAAESNSSANGSAPTGELAEVVLTCDQTPALAVHNVGVRLKRRVVTRSTPGGGEEIAAAIDLAYARYATSADRPHDDLHEPRIVIEAPAHGDESGIAAAMREAERDLLSTHGKSQVVRLVDLIFFDALRLGASDVHIQPLRDRVLVRYRLDGALHTVRELPGGSSTASAMVSRVKVMAHLDVAERRAPQDGHASVTIGQARSTATNTTLYSKASTSAASREEAREVGEGGRRVDLRVSTLPSTYGERVVVRLLDASRSPHLKSFVALGMPKGVERRYLEQVSRTSGIVLSTGPTGSGKTTTLYTTLAWISETNAGSNITSDRGAEHEDAPDRAQASSTSSSSPSSLRGSVPSSLSSPSSPSSLRGSAPSSPSSCELNIMTIEDPVEYDLGGVLIAREAHESNPVTSSAAGSQTGSALAHRAASHSSGLAISQTQVDPKKNVTFATGLRHILRQDPDVIMVGEIRDEETARIAVQASLTGHLVLSTLHTGDAASAVARLLDLGVEPFLVSSSLSAVLAQRLVRTVHRSCEGRGCEACLGSGLKGRTGIFELLVVDSAIRELINSRASANIIKDAACRDGGGGGGTVTLADAGRRLVEQGITTPTEVARVIDMTEEPPQA